MDAKPPRDAAQTARVYAEVAERAGKLLADFAQKHPPGVSAGVTDELGIAKAFMDLYGRMLADPYALADDFTEFLMQVRKDANEINAFTIAGGGITQ